MNQNDPLNNNDDINFKETIIPFLRHWPWFILTVLILLLIAFLHLRYSTYIYKSEATILIKDDKNNSLSELAAFEDLGLGGGAGLSKSDFENEIEIIKSRKIISEVVNDLNLNISYFREGNIKTTEIFKNRPFTLEVVHLEDSLKLKRHFFYIKQISSDSFSFFENDLENQKKIQQYGTSFKTQIGEIIVYSNSNKSKVSELLTIIKIDNIDNTINDLRKKINIEAVSKNSSVLSLSYSSSASDKSEIILDKLINSYNNDAIADRNLISANTARFIDKRLAIITEELDSVENNNVNFREKNRVTDIAVEGQLHLQDASQLQKKQAELSTRIGLTNSMKEYLVNNNDQLLPANLGLTDDGVSRSIEEYNKLLLEKERLLKSSTEINPIVISLTEQIQKLRDNIEEGLNTINNSLQIEDRDLRRQRNKVGGEIGTIPSLTKAAKDIMRQQEIKEALYLYLLQKREETAISLAVTAPKAKIVDRAYTSRLPISPKPRIIYLAALILGLLIPFGIIYLKILFDTKIHNRLDVEKEVPSIPILGEVPTIDSKESETIISNDRSVLAEAFRIMRTNLSYFIKSKSNNGILNNTIFVTSTIKGEGKTFVAYNLALTLSSTGKSILLIGADIRNPQLHRYIDKNEWTMGLSEYLYDNEVDKDTVINQVYNDQEKFDLILSGRIPPNPAELLMNGRFEHLINEVRDKYDYVIVDTAPTLLVTDTLLISQLSDLTVYVSRAEYTDKKLLQYPKELVEDKKLKNVAFAINGIKMTNFGYGSKYGYGYGQDTQSLMKRIKSKLGIRK